MPEPDLAPTLKALDRIVAEEVREREGEAGCSCACNGLQTPSVLLQQLLLALPRS